MPRSRHPFSRLWPWLAALVGLLLILPLALLGSIAVTLGDAVLVVLVFGLWEVWMLLLIVDWNELRTLLSPARLKAPWWQGALKVVGYGIAGLYVAGLVLGLGESKAQQAARQQWRRGAVPETFVLTPLPVPAIASLVPPPLPAPARREPPLPGPPLVEPVAGPPLEAALAQQQKDAAAKAPPAPAPAPSEPAPQPAPPAQPAPQSAPAPQPAAAPDPNQSPCFGKVKVYTTDHGQRLYALPGWPDFLRYAATNWYCSEAQAQSAGFRPGPH